MDFALLIPITLFLCITYAIKAVVDARVRKQLVASNGDPALVRGILEGDETARRLASLRWGITLVALALGFGIVDLRGWQEITPGVIAVLVGLYKALGGGWTQSADTQADASHGLAIGARGTLTR